MKSRSPARVAGGFMLAASCVFTAGCEMMVNPEGTPVVVDGVEYSYDPADLKRVTDRYIEEAKLITKAVGVMPLEAEWNGGSLSGLDGGFSRGAWEARLILVFRPDGKAESHESLAEVLATIGWSGGEGHSHGRYVYKDGLMMSLEFGENKTVLIANEREPSIPRVSSEGELTPSYVDFLDQLESPQ